MSKLLGALDLGTTSIRFLVIDAEGRVISAAQKEHKQITPKPGWLEHDPNEIINNSRYVIDLALSQAKLTAKDLLSIGITNQRETVVVWDESGIPVYNAIVWQDTRTKEICEELAKKIDLQAMQQLTGLPLSTYFSATKLKWINDNVRKLDASIKIGTIDSWVLWNLAGKHVTDVTNASRTWLCNIKDSKWNETLLKIFSVPEQSLPKILPSVCKDFGSAKIGNYEVLVGSVLGDQHAALFGQGCFEKGEMKNTYGTGCFLLLNTGTDIVTAEGLLSTVAYKIENEKTVYALEGSVAVAGALLQWLRDDLNLVTSAKEIDELAASVADTADAYIVPAFSGLFAPYWRDDARGVIVGLTRSVKKAHLARAALESACFQVCDLLQSFESAISHKISELRVDGGMAKSDLLLQIQSDLSNIKIIRSANLETTALGVAFAAGLSCGAWKDLSEIKDLVKTSGVFNSKIKIAEREHRKSRWKQAVERTLNWN